MSFSCFACSLLRDVLDKSILTSFATIVRFLTLLMNKLAKRYLFPEQHRIALYSSERALNSAGAPTNFSRILLAFKNRYEISNAEAETHD
jgi:hypothetical protein